MPKFAGTTSGSIRGTTYNIPAKIVSYSLGNSTGGNITVHVKLTDNANAVDYEIYTAVMAGNTSFIYNGEGYTLLSADWSIYITTTGALEYYFTIAPL